MAVTGSLLLGITYAAFGVERILELALNRRHVIGLLAKGARIHPDDGFGLIVLVQMGAFVAIAAEWFTGPWTGIGWWTWAGLAVVVLANVLRYWCITTLGERWTVRVVTLPHAPLVNRGPYRFLRHPNYVAVFLELPALALAFGCFASAGAIALLQTVALSRRIRREEAALGAETPWPARTSGRKRFLVR